MSDLLAGSSAWEAAGIPWSPQDRFGNTTGIQTSPASTRGTHRLWKYPFLSTYRVKNLLEFGSRGRVRAAQGWLNKHEKPRSNPGLYCDPSTGEAETSESL